LTNVKDRPNVGRMIDAMSRRASPLLIFLTIVLAMAAGAAPTLGALRLAGSGNVVVVCADGAETTLRLGPDGRPAGDPECAVPCPDCLPPATFGLPAPAASQSEQVLAVRAVVFAAAHAVPFSTRLVSPTARGPPGWTVA
jgi:hypothetical protein